MHMVQESTCFLTAPQWDRLYYDELQEFLVAYLTLIWDAMLSAMFLRLSRIRWSIVSQHQHTSKSQAVQNAHHQKHSSALLNLPYRPRHNESHSSKNPVSLSVIWPQKLAFTFDVLINEAAMLSMSWYYQNSKDNENQLGSNEARFILFESSVCGLAKLYKASLHISYTDQYVWRLREFPPPATHLHTNWLVS